MLALVVVLIGMVLLLGVLVVGLLRSHADIIRTLHDLGVGVGDPAGRSPVAAPGPTPVTLRIGPSLASERSSSSVHDLEGVSPAGDALVISATTSDLTLLAFLSSGCSSCASFWTALGDPDQRRLLPAATRVVAVTKGPEFESPETIAAKALAGVPVIMSTSAWSDYEVPGSPFFVLVDGPRRTRIGEGVAQHMAQIADLLRRASLDDRASGASGSNAAGTDAERERDNDRQLRRAGIHPGHPSLYPHDLDDVFAATGDRAVDRPREDQSARGRH